MVQLTIQNFTNMNRDRDARARDLITRAEVFRNRKLRPVRRRLDFGGFESLSGDNSPHSLAATMNPNMEEINSQEAKNLQDKYNFDFVKEEVKDGPFKWETVVVTPSNADTVPDYYIRPPHKKKARPMSPELVAYSQGNQDSPFDKDSSSSNGSTNSLRLSPKTPVTRQLFSTGKESENDSCFTAIAGKVPDSSTSTASSILPQGSSPLPEEGHDTGLNTGTHHDLTTFTSSISSLSCVDTHKPNLG